ncbi:MULTISPECIES: hypothetical protein [unclassified Bradyrhizobium]|uniref:hypothetical protein n=1 Tax=unclassified Bradyrhizobium TaxID=2631580 RepID=UPI00188BDEE6|nr:MULTISPECIES: hypothetical protein [unclassified Bradyrhizobium]MDN4985130.1 hypothetical protein [Bradyrhizobium sp. WYCCWR 13022]
MKPILTARSLLQATTTSGCPRTLTKVGVLSGENVRPRATTLACVLSVAPHDFQTTTTN